MKRLAYMFSILLLFGAYGCASSGDIKYTGVNEDAREGSWIKDPEAVGTTRDSGARQDTTRTESNRVDIPILEFAQIGCVTSGAAATRRSGYDGRYVRIGYSALTLQDYVSKLVTVQGYRDGHTTNELWARSNSTIYPALYSDEQYNHRYSRDGYSASSAEDQAWTNTARLTTEGLRSTTNAHAMTSETYLEAGHTRYGYEAAFNTRVIGLHLWKYADREVVGDNVEITYTIVYYNTNEFDTGPTEIDEPVPYYTEYIADTATLPKEGTSVAYLKRDDARNILRWKFPKGIKAGETNSMKYKVTVRLDPSPEYRPPEDKPGEPRKQ